MVSEKGAERCVHPCSALTGHLPSRLRCAAPLSDLLATLLRRLCAERPCYHVCLNEGAIKEGSMKWSKC